MVKLDFLSVLDEKAQFLNDFSDDIWADPETAFTEFHAAGRYCSALRSEGFEVTENLAGIPTAFSGRFGSGHPVIGVLAEFDALSGLSQEGGVTEKRSAGGGGMRPRLRAQPARHGQPRRGHRHQALSGDSEVPRHGHPLRLPRRGGRLRQGVHGARRRV